MCSPATARCEKVLFFTTIACTPKNAARATNFTKKQVLGQKSWSAAGPLHATCCSFRQLHCALLFSKGPALPRKHSGTPARRPGTRSFCAWLLRAPSGAMRRSSKTGLVPDPVLARAAGDALLVLLPWPVFWALPLCLVPARTVRKARGIQARVVEASLCRSQELHRSPAMGFPGGVLPFRADVVQSFHQKGWHLSDIRERSFPCKRQFVSRSHSFLCQPLRGF